MTARLYVRDTLHPDRVFQLPPGAARHVQVLRLQPGHELTLFNGEGGEWRAQVVRMGRDSVQVQVLTHEAADRELPCLVTLAVGMPANERMDLLVEKATELGVARIQPVLCERSVLRLQGERAQRRVAHWQGVAVAASEQSGRTRVPEVAQVNTLREWLGSLGSPVAHESRFVLSLRSSVAFDPTKAGRAAAILSGPEGGLTEAEEALALAAGFAAVSLGARTLRADTAPLAVQAALSMHCMT
jgi:16S rRNA (uracil1498-N3)-methyltransferase